jgi:thiol-disulfide isomerase/thioredoxin
VRCQAWIVAGGMLTALTVARPAAADRVQVFSIQGVDCGHAEEEVRPYLKKLDGVKKWSFDKKKWEFTMTLADGTPDGVVIDAFEKQGCFKAIPGAGHSARLKAYAGEPYPAGADVMTVTDKGEDVGPLENLRVPGKYTVLDFYASWCGPCVAVDKRLREILAVRKDVAVRKLNVDNFKSPLAKQMGRKLRGLPFLIVFTPDGKRTDIAGANHKQLKSALGIKS